MTLMHKAIGILQLMHLSLGTSAYGRLNHLRAFIRHTHTIDQRWFRSLAPERSKMEMQNDVGRTPTANGAGVK